MSINFHEMADKERMYAFVGSDGENIHVAVERLFKWVQDHKKHLRVWHTPIYPHMAGKFIRDGLVNRDRVRELIPKKQADLGPIIYGKERVGRVSKVDMYLLDGRHRYVRAASLCFPLIEAYILEPGEWFRFQVFNIPKIDQSMLDRIPVVSGPR